MTKHTICKSGRKGDGQEWFIKIKFQEGEEWIEIRTEDGNITVHEEDIDWLIDELDHMRLKIITNILKG